MRASFLLLAHLMTLLFLNSGSINSPNVSNEQYNTTFNRDACAQIIQYLSVHDQMFGFGITCHFHRNITLEYHQNALQAWNTMMEYVSRINTNVPFNYSVIYQITMIRDQFLSDDMFVYKLPKMIKQIHKTTQQIGRNNARTLLRIFNVISSATMEWSNTDWKDLDDFSKLMVVSSRCLLLHYVRPSAIIGSTCNPIDNWIIRCGVHHQPAVAMHFYKVLFHCAFSQCLISMHELNRKLGVFGFIPFDTECLFISTLNSNSNSNFHSNLLQIMQTYDAMISLHNSPYRPYRLHDHYFVTEINIHFCVDILQTLADSKEEVPVFVGSFVVSQCASYISKARGRYNVLKEIAPILIHIIRKGLMRLVIQRDRFYQEEILNALIAEDHEYILGEPVGNTRMCCINY